MNLGPEIPPDRVIMRVKDRGERAASSDRQMSARKVKHCSPASLHTRTRDSFL